MHRILNRSSATILCIACLISTFGCGEKETSPEATSPQETPAPANADSPSGEPSAAAEPEAGQVQTPIGLVELDADSLLEMRLSEKQTRDGWVRLFDGTSLYGWTMTGRANWTVNDGVISVSSGDASFVCTSIPWSNFECELEFKAPLATNSGIFLRSPLVPTDPASDCYELNIAPPENPFPTGSLVARRKLESNDLGPWDADAWHTYLIRAENDTITIALDGKELYRYTDPNPIAKGHIALQHNQGLVEFRNIIARPIGMRSLLPESLSSEDPSIDGWKRYPDMDGEFQITADGFLRALGGKNQLETTDQFDDFALLVEAKTAGEGQNSGIFFRCIPGEEMNGYECQINNDLQDNNPLLPADCGTGGIFRRQDARLIAAENGEWFRLLLVAEGPSISAWVNGIQVSDWTDEREPDPNPRRGQKLAAGTIMLQAHDPGTDVTFKSIQILASSQSE